MAQQPDTSAGFASGILYWLMFTVGFALLGYPPILCITLGFLAGITTGVITAWLQAEERDAPANSEEAKPSESASQQTGIAPSSDRFQQYGLTGLRPRRPQSHRRRPAVRRFGWLFQRKR